MNIKRKKTLLWTSFFLVVTAFFLGYWFYQSIPTDFPGKEFANSEIMDLFPEADIQEIQEIIMLDEKHVFTPFITNQQSYGGSLWEWKYHKWQFISIDTDFKPRIWKAEPENPASYIILWNFHPDNNLKSLTFYLKKEKGYSVTEGKELYQPSIQMEYIQPLDGELSYGYMEIPRQWREFITIENKVTQTQLPDSFFAEMSLQPQYYFGWRIVSNDGSEDYPRFPQNSHGFGTGDHLVEQMIFLDKVQIE